MDLIKIAEEAFATGKQHPSFKAGDTVTVAYRIIEGNKERVQLYRGVVIKIAGHGEKKRFTVRKMSGTVAHQRVCAVAFHVEVGRDAVVGHLQVVVVGHQASQVVLRCV